MSFRATSCGEATGEPLPARWARTPIAAVVIAGRCIAPSGILSKPMTAASRPGVKPRSGSPSMTLRAHKSLWQTTAVEASDLSRKSCTTAASPPSVIRALPPTRRSSCTTGMPWRFSSSTTSAAVRSAGASRMPVDLILAHAGGKAALAGECFGGTGDEGDPACLIKRVIVSRRKLGVERIGDFADDQPDVEREACAQIRRSAMIDIAKRVHGRLSAGPGGRRDQRAVAKHQRNGRRGHSGKCEATSIENLKASSAAGKSTYGSSGFWRDPAAAPNQRLRPSVLRVAILRIDGIHAILSGCSLRRNDRAT
jgi:hypothetical protein